MISKVEITNYKKFQEKLTVDFTEGFNVLIGKNNAGKTTLLNVINAFLNNSVKIFDKLKNSLKNNQSIASPEIKVFIKDQKYFLDTSKTTWKWSTKIESASGYITAHATAEEITKNINNFFKSQIKTNKILKEEFEREFQLFAKSLNLNSVATKVIFEANDDYSVQDDSDLSKAVAIAFNAQLPGSIINKGFGQQKEFLINYFITKTVLRENETEVLLVDEIENSLSINSLRKIIQGFQNGDKNKQVIVSSHNPEAIGKDNFGTKNIITIGPPPMWLLPEQTIFCEGSTDRKKFLKIFPKFLFIPARGSNIIDTAQAYEDSKQIFYAIVDGDEAGLDYKSKIQGINKNFNVHTLNQGTIEDYYAPNSIEEAFRKNGLEVPTKITQNFLQDCSFNGEKANDNAKKTKEKVKKWLEMYGKFIKKDLQLELGNFLKQIIL